MPVNEPYIKQKICDSEIGEKKVSKLDNWAHGLISQGCLQRERKVLRQRC